MDSSHGLSFSKALAILKENGAPGMQPNLYKVVYYQWLIEVAFWKSGPKSGPINFEPLKFPEDVSFLTHHKF